MERQIFCYPDKAMLSNAVADYITKLASNTIAQKGMFTCAVSGGKTPEMLFGILAERKLQWSKVHIFLVDERYVPQSDPLSNFLLLDRTLLSKISIPEENVHAVNTALTPQTAVEQYETELNIFFKTKEPFPVFDLILLGIGGDGHIASLFPGDKKIGAVNSWVRDIDAPSILPQVRRITLTMNVINNAKNIVFIVNGANKAEILGKILEEEDTSLPAVMVNPNKGNLIFFVDNDACSRLNSNIVVKYP